MKSLFLGRLALLQLLWQLSYIVGAGRPSIPKDWPDTGLRGGEAMVMLDRAPRNCLCRVDELFQGRFCTSEHVFQDHCMPIGVTDMRRSWRSPTGSCPKKHKCVAEWPDRDGRSRTRCAPNNEHNLDSTGRDRDQSSRGGGGITGWARSLSRSASRRFSESFGQSSSSSAQTGERDGFLSRFPNN